MIYLDTQLPDAELFEILPELTRDYAIELTQNSSMDDKQWFNDLRMNVFKAIREGKLPLTIDLARFMFCPRPPNDTPEFVELQKDYHIRYGSAVRGLVWASQ